MKLRNKNHWTFIEAPRVLLVEDHDILAKATADLLRTEGLEVQIASTGGQALASVGTFRPDIILCDLNLPDMAGVDVARDLRKSLITTDALFVIHTAFRDADLEGIDIPFFDLSLSKPLTREKIETLLDWLQQSHRPKKKADILVF